VRPNRTLQADPKQLKAAWAAGSLTRRALRRPPLSRPRHLGDPRQALSALLWFIRLEGSIPLPRQPTFGSWLSAKT